MSVFVHAQGLKTVHAGGGVQKWQNSVHVVVECPPIGCSNFDKRCSGAHFVSFLFHYYCMLLLKECHPNDVVCKSASTLAVDALSRLSKSRRPKSWYISNFRSFPFIFGVKSQISARQIHFFFKISNARRSSFPCFVRFVNWTLNLKLCLCYITLRTYRNQNQKQFHVQCSVHKCYKTRKWTTSCIGYFEEKMDLSCIYLPVITISRTTTRPCMRESSLRKFYYIKKEGVFCYTFAIFFHKKMRY